MKKTVLALFCTILFFLTTESALHAQALQSTLPEPVWVASTPNLLPADVYVRKANNHLYIMDAYGKVSILNDGTGKQIAEVDPTSPTSKMAYSGFFGGNQVGKNGNLYLTTSENDTKNNRLTRRLQAYNSSGKALWVREFSRPIPKTFAEKVSDISGIFINNDGTLLFYMSLERYKFIVFQIDQQGKQLQKKEINEFVNSYHNNMMTTLLNWSGKAADYSDYKATLTVYDSKLNRLFNQKIDGLKFRGILPDKTLLFYKFNKTTTDVIAKNSKGAILWKKSVPGKITLDNFGQDNEAFNSEYLVASSNQTLYVFNSKGLSAQSKVALNNQTANLSFTMSGDGNILIVDEKSSFPKDTPEQIIILKGSDLSRIGKIAMPAGAFLETAYLYKGQGWLYRWFDDMNNPDLQNIAIQKYDLNL
ncbi:hypothetical protein J23TS9_53360 [Paenibacillus sp. J23TS9]|uniref:hypothetical protein n=1 Tax=Paenibacillus sp. J23TS9 TaxID=2807193 RepID=UPI001B160BAF|nr:hypothetical protein [Paenibacillus sp. J23TS9]GIP30206.1 hypothetical protein J23TS9_53360 [Paenibacillus sp. J23TS9]